MPDYWESNLNKQCRLCLTNTASFMAVPTIGDDKFTPYPVCKSCAGETEEPEITATTRLPDAHTRIEHCVCTSTIDETEPDEYCGRMAAVFVLEDGKWKYDCLCEDHLQGSWVPEELANYRRNHSNA